MQLALRLLLLLGQVSRWVREGSLLLVLILFLMCVP
jgi:hypothetical protein